MDWDAAENGVTNPWFYDISWLVLFLHRLNLHFSSIQSRIFQNEWKQRRKSSHWGQPKTSITLAIHSIKPKHSMPFQQPLPSVSLGSHAGMTWAGSWGNVRPNGSGFDRTSRSQHEIHWAALMNFPLFDRIKQTATPANAASEFNDCGTKWDLWLH